MNELLTDPLVQEFWSNFVTGEITILTGLVWLGVAILFSIAGGAIGGILLAQKDLGFRLSAMIGGLFGPAAIIPATILGLIVLKIA